MRFHKIELYQFRNFEKIALDPNPRINVFIGQNGQGKTNLVESIFLLSKGRSFRISDNNSLINKEFKISSKLLGSFIDKREKSNKLELKLIDGKKKFIFNEKNTIKKIIERALPTVIFSPESLDVVKSSASHRRELVDDFIASLNDSYSNSVPEFKKILSARNKVLKQCASERPVAKEYLDIVNQKFIEASIHLTKARLEIVKKLSPFFDKSLKGIMGPQYVDNSVEYFIKEKIDNNSGVEQLRSQFEDQLVNYENREKIIGTSMFGPQKHDLLFNYNGNEARYYCSQGQQRAIILAFKIAQIIYHFEFRQEYPILLLDDVLSELDLERRTNLLQFLQSVSAQTFITTTDLSVADRFDHENTNVYQVDNGKIHLMVN